MGGWTTASVPPYIFLFLDHLTSRQLAPPEWASKGVGGAHRESASKKEASLFTLVVEFESCHSFHVLLVRRKSLGPPSVKGRGFHRGGNTRKPSQNLPASALQTWRAHHPRVCFLLTLVQSCLHVEFFCLLPLWSQISSLKWSISKQYLESRSTSLAPLYHLCLWTHWAVPGSWGFLEVMGAAIFLQGSQCLPRSEQRLLNIVLNISYFHNCIIQCSFDWNMITEFHCS